MKNCKKGILPWKGGKRLLADKIINLMPKHTCYVEVFAGGAAVYFKKDPATVDVINDINGELINFYRVTQNHLRELRRYMARMVISRTEFYRFRETPPHILTDIQRAARFLYIQKNCFGGRAHKPTFGISKKEMPRFRKQTLLKTLAGVSKRLEQTIIECMPYGEVISRYDSDNTLFYLDPPYHGLESYYGTGIFSREDYKLLQEQLTGIKGKFIMSINDVPEIRELFSKFKIVEVTTHYSINQERNANVGELLILNF